MKRIQKKLVKNIQWYKKDNAGGEEENAMKQENKETRERKKWKPWKKNKRKENGAEKKKE